MNIVLSSIPMKPHLKQFVLFMENPGEDGVLHLQRGGTISYVLKMVLEGKMKLPYNDEFQLDGFYGDRLYFKVESSMLAWNKIGISAKKIAMFNHFVHHLLNDLVLDRIQVAKRKHKAYELETVYDFLEDSDLQEILDVDTLRKSIYRLKKRKSLVKG